MSKKSIDSSPRLPRSVAVGLHAHTYYAKQLAQQAVLAASSTPIVANEIEVS
jgi:hypothetical protein